MPEVPDSVTKERHNKLWASVQIRAERFRWL